MNILNYINTPVAQNFISNKTISNITELQLSILTSLKYLNENNNVIIVTKDKNISQRLCDLISPLVNEEVLLYELESSLRIRAINESIEEQFHTLQFISKLKDKNLIVTDIGSLLTKVSDLNSFNNNIKNIVINKEVDYKQLKVDLINMGYKYSSVVDAPMYFSYRGEVVDIFPPNRENPIRIEFFDNIIESIREYDINTRLSINKLESIDIYPADIRFDNQIDINKFKADISHEDNNELINNLNYILDNINEEDLQNKHLLDNYRKDVSIIQYFDDPNIIYYNIEDINNAYDNIIEDSNNYINELYNSNDFLNINNIYNSKDYILLSNGYYINKFDNDLSIDIPYKSLVINELSIEQKYDYIKSMSKDNKVIICIKEENIRPIKSRLSNIKQIHYINQDISEGFEDIYNKVIVISKNELFATSFNYKKVKKEFKHADILSSFNDLQINDYVVHQKNGVGKYVGIVTKKNNNNLKDYLKILYRGDDELYVPLEQFKLVRKFVSRDGIKPRLNKLGTDEWKKTKEKVTKNIEIIADQLIETFVARTNDIGFAFSTDNKIQQEFENEFEYELTKDQIQSINEIKKDMESNKPMDRLLCGDVGFGKTEVAIRAAMKTVLDNKQVMFLCPTTILSNQHYETFKKRFENFPVRIAVLNRFIKPRQRKVIIEDLKNHKIDIIIGTHALLSKNIEFADLGFLVIDEEQRFGVTHKEKIKNIKVDVDVLALSATPIPRSLQMSLISIRGLSQLTTPPVMRTSIKTYVVEKNLNLVKEVIEREVDRNGQVFYVYNNVERIYDVAATIKNLSNKFEVGVVHGQMSKDEIDEVMCRFINNEYNILVATTIIETGIDISNANTILIDNADCFGLSSLYQLKGRVGRRERTAYAYLMYNKNKQISEIAEKRLKSIKEFSVLGSGYKIAMRDLVIRGAGDLLGAKQAGFIDTVGIDMYLEILNDAIMQRKGILKEEKKELINVNLKSVAYIPKQFTNEDSDKIELYANIDKIDTLEELDTYNKFVVDNYGKLPESVNNLFNNRRITIMRNYGFIEDLKESERNIRIVLTSEYSNSIDGVALFENITKVSRDIKLTYMKSKIEIYISISNHKEKDLINVLEVLMNCNSKENNNENR